VKVGNFENELKVLYARSVDHNWIIIIILSGRIRTYSTEALIQLASGQSVCIFSGYIYTNKSATSQDKRRIFTVNPDSSLFGRNLGVCHNTPNL
jgi:hypothetical protein